MGLSVQQTVASVAARVLVKPVGQPPGNRVGAELAAVETHRVPRRQESIEDNWLASQSAQQCSEELAVEAHKEYVVFSSKSPH